MMATIRDRYLDGRKLVLGTGGKTRVTVKKIAVSGRSAMGQADWNWQE